MLKLAPRTSGTLLPENLAAVKKEAGTKLDASSFLAVLTVIAELLDSAAKGQNCYMTIGSTKDKSALSITVNYDGVKESRFGGTLAELSERVADWL